LVLPRLPGVLELSEAFRCRVLALTAATAGLAWLSVRRSHASAMMLTALLAEI
jgi:hypothetical protein